MWDERKGRENIHNSNNNDSYYMVSAMGQDNFQSLTTVNTIILATRLSSQCSYPTSETRDLRQRGIK